MIRIIQILLKEIQTKNDNNKKIRKTNSNVKLITIIINKNKIMKNNNIKNLK